MSYKIHLIVDLIYIISVKRIQILLNGKHYKALLQGPQGSIYEGGYYMVKIIFSKNYPNEKPSVYFLNKIFHPNVCEITNRVCILPPKNDVISVLDTVENMFFDYKENIHHAYSNTARKLLEENREDEFIATAKRYVKDYAKLKDLDRFYDKVLIFKRF